MNGRNADIAFRWLAMPEPFLVRADKVIESP